MTDLRFDGRVAVVTGAGNGLGRAHALLLAARGARVVVNDLGGSVTGDGSDPGPADAVVAEIRDGGGEAVADGHSVATPEGGAAVIQTALDAFGRLDILVNNAGILRDAPFPDLTPELVDPVLDVHLRGAFHVTLPAWRVMRERGSGRIVNTTSAVGLLGERDKSNYGAAKGGILGLTRCLALEGAAHDIKVNAVAPSAATRMLAHSMPEDGTMTAEGAAMMEAITKQLDPALVSPVVAFLAHESCPVTGEFYSAGAGGVARYFTARTRGWYDPALSIEDIRDHLDEIRDETGYTVPGQSGDDIAQFLQAIAAAAG